jgi:uncharacterized membrane protein YeaQ/YmgE (transglycosylase-associated protein family)
VSPKTLIWIGVIIGSTIGEFVPALWGDAGFTVSSIIFSTIGGVIGIWAGWKLSQMF